MKIKFVALIAILACLLIVIPAGYAVNNDTLSDDGEVLQADYYFDAKIDKDTGNGSIDNPYKELTASRIESNSVLHLASGEYDLSNSKTVNNVTIIGENPTATIIKNAKFTVSSSLTLCNLTLLASPITNNGNLTATNMIFKDSTQYNGGAISSNSNSNVTLDNCTFINNGASFGGAIYCMEGWMYIENSRFLNNTAEEFGGAILSISAETYIIGSKFKDNKANYYGGAIYTLYSPFGVMNSIFDNNSARDGGALLIDDASLCLIFSNEFSNNRADSVGAVYSIANNVTGSLLNDNSFLNNSGSVANDVLESATPNMFISNGDYILAYYNPTFNGTIPSRYDLRELGYVTPVKNQGSSKCCWAFAAIASLESCILKATGISYDLSEDNVKNIMTRYSDYGWTYTVSTGGRDDMGMGYFIGWLGPVNESDDPFSASSFMSPVLNSFYHVQNLIFLQRNNYTDNDAIKKAIIEYGAVATSIYWSAGLYGSNGNYYYPGSEGSNHAVTIVGWDDNYSKSNFKNTPEGDGAWIVKNSHGTSNGKGGYWYVSYYDTRCAQVGSYDVSYTFILNDTIKYDKNYQYDIPGRTDIFVNSSSTVWYKNRFTATDNEYLAAVSTYFDKLSNYTIYIYVNNALKHVQSGISNAGYYTFDLNKFVPLSIGDIFEVVFKVSVDGEAYFPVSEPAVLNKVLFSANTSFVSYDGENWTDLFNLTWRYSTHNYKSSVACIKAFTVYDVINTTTELSVGLTDSYNIKASVLNQYNRPVTGGTVTFNIDGKNCDVDVVNGKAIISLPADSEVHNVTAEYNNVGYISSADNLTFPSSLMATNISLTLSGEYNPLSITAVVLDSKGSVVEIGNVTFTVDGIPYSVDIANGSATFTRVFETFKKHNVTAKFNLGFYYDSSEMSLDFILNPTIISKDEVKTFNSQYRIKLLDNHGKELNNAEIILVVNSISRKVKTDENGFAVLDIDVSPNRYVIEIINPCTGEVKTQNIDVVARICENKDVVMYYGAGKYYTVKVLDDDGNAAVGVGVTFTINNNRYNVKTDKNGFASFKLSLMPGNYIITAEYKDFRVFNTVTVKTTLITKDIKVKKGKPIKFSAKLLDKNGKALKNKKIKFKFDGKKYKAKTNKKGKATLKITKKYKVGKYPIISSYGKLKVKNTIQIKK